MKYQKGDCRARGKPEGRPITMNSLGKKEGYPEPASGPNRQQRRTERHFRGIRKNTVGVPLGFSPDTWMKRCAEIALAYRDDDASHGESVKSVTGKRHARPQDTNFKGLPNSKHLRKMIRANGVKTTLNWMRGLNRGIRFFHGYAKVGMFDRRGGRLVAPRMREA